MVAQLLGNTTVRLLRKALLRERAGNTAMIFALLTPVLVLLGGGAVDLTNASMRQSNLQQAADAAAVGAVARSSPGYQAALTMSGNGQVTASNLNPNALAIFNANRRASGDTSIPNFTVDVEKNGTVVSSTVTASDTFSTSFLGLIGQRSIHLAATSHATDNIPAFMTFYMLLDNTPSMGIAATTAGITTMVNATPDQCAFACHDLSNGNNYYNLAKSLKVNTRIYNVAQASANLLSTAQSTETANGVPGEFTVALYDFGATATDPTSASYTGFNQVYPLVPGTVTSDLTSASTAAAAIDLMTVNFPGQFNDEDTQIGLPLSFAATNLTSSGNGTSALTPENVLFVVSDGATDTYNPAKDSKGNCIYNDGNACRQIIPIDPTPCNTLKSHGVQVAVLYTTYLPLPTNPFWQAWIASLQGWLAPWTSPPPSTSDQIANNMKACASPGLYFEVNSSQDINAAMQALFQKVVASVKITS